MTARACDRCLARSQLLAAVSRRIERVGRSRKRLPALLALPDRELLAALGFDELEVRRLLGEAAEAASRSLPSGLGATCRHDDRFPARLRRLPDEPAALFFAGAGRRLDQLQRETCVALVGARRASAYGREIARTLGRELAVCGIVVISGMAFGIDAVAHAGALEGSGLTVAVLGSGADVPYPRHNSRLHARIASSGLVLSELPPGFNPSRWCFPARNRLIAALAEMTVVVEGRHDSGSLITARIARELGSDVGAVPGRVTSRLADGPNALIADGACLVRSGVDVVEAILGATAAAGIRALAPARPALDPGLERLLAAVESGLETVEAIARGPDDVAEVVAGLSELELLGLVRGEPSGRYTRRVG